MNGHINGMIHSKNKVAEQIVAVNLVQTTGSMADKLVQVESKETLAFLAPLSPLIEKRRRPAMETILPGIYNMDRLAIDKLTEEQEAAILLVSPLKAELFFKKIYLSGSILICHQEAERKRSSSICSYRSAGGVAYGRLEKFCFSPPIALIRPYKSRSSILLTAGDPERDVLRKYSSGKGDKLRGFIVEVYRDISPVIAVPIADLLGKCVCVTTPRFNYVINIPNTFEHM